jgi:H+/gluconate symporter-like permease
LSPKLLTRAFTVYGHSILAGLIIGIPLTICYFLFIAFYISTSGY